MKANHPNEAKRWIEAIGRNIEHFKQREREVGGESDTSSGKRRRSMESFAENGVKFGVTPSSSNGSTSTAGQRGFWRKSNGSRDRDQESIVGSISRPNSVVATPVEPATPRFPDPDAMFKDVAIEGESEDEDSSDTKENELEPPHPDAELQGNALTAQLEMTNRMVESMTASSQASNPQIQQALTESLQTAQSLLSTFLHMSREREDWFIRQLREERKRQRVWEESLAVVVREGEGLERELRRRRGRGSSFLASGGGTQKERLGKRRPSLVGMSATGTIKGTPGFPPEELTDELKAIAPISVPVPTSKGTQITRTTTIDTIVAPVPPLRPTAIIITPATSRIEEKIVLDEEDHDTDEEDEFFDAIEMGNLPNLVVHEGLTSPKTITSPGLVTPRASTQAMLAETEALGPSDIRSLSISQALLLSKGVEVEPFAGYAALRNRLSITDDDRPSTSLWSVLKHSIGKDLTKISFPVFFNEPTSMLQRMAEDMEFSECCEFLVSSNICNWCLNQSSGCSGS
jgi:flagellar basal body rod protein FlgC